MAGKNDDRDNDKALREQVENTQSYPLLTEDVGTTRGSRPSRTGTSGAAPLGQLVDNALRDVLGWRPQASDAQGFVAALNQSFEVKEVEGRVEWTWTPRTYAISAEMGAVTGAQASIYTRAKAMLDQSLPLLAGLTALRPDNDQEDSDAIRAIVKSSLTELVAELGREGGPRVARVDELFELLLGADADLRDPDRIGGQLGMLRERFGLRGGYVNTIGEEQNLTNFLILVDHAASLRLTWTAQRHFFDLRGTDVFLGTQLVLLSRALAVVSESLDTTYLVMDSVFLGQAERQVLELKFKDGSHMFLGDLLSWVERFATEEGPRLIRDGGKDGVIAAFAPTAKRLHSLIQATRALSLDTHSSLPQSFHTARVQRALGELSNHLNEVEILANQVRRTPPPHPLLVTPRQAPKSSLGSIRLAIEGNDFQPRAGKPVVKLVFDKDNAPAGEAVEEKREAVDALQKDVLGSEVIIVSERQLNATFDLSGAHPGFYTAVIVNPDGGNGSLRNAFEIVDDPMRRPRKE